MVFVVLLVAHFYYYNDLKRLNVALRAEESVNRNIKLENIKIRKQRDCLIALIKEADAIEFPGKSKTQSFLKTVCKELGLTANERVLLYIKYDDFFQVASFTQNKKFQRNTILQVPSDDLAFHTASQSGVYIDKQCPNFLTKPSLYRRYKKMFHKLSDYDVDNMAMKACRSLVIATTDDDKTIEMIVFQSTNSGFIKKDDRVKQIEQYCNDQRQHIWHLLYTNDTENVRWLNRFDQSS